MKHRKNLIRRVVRGGGYFNAAKFLRVTCRYWDLSERRIWGNSFRFVVRGKK